MLVLSLMARSVDSEHPPTRLAAAAGWMLGAMVLLPIMDGVAKHLSATYPVAQVVWARYLFHLAVLVPVALARYGRRIVRPPRLPVQLLRGTLLLASTALFFAAIARMPMANTLALFFVSPLVVTVLAARLLGERVGAWRWLAVLVGFAGVLAILRPGSGMMHGAALLAIGAGTVHGLYMVTTRQLAGTSEPLVTLLYTALVGAVVMSLVVPFVWRLPTPLDMALMVLLGLLAAGGHFSIIQAFDRATASWLAPLAYAEIVTSTLVGYIGFGDFPDGFTWLGIAVIVAAGVAISLRERRPYRTGRPGA